MGRIEVLDRNMINMIAAGEVIERPASVVKELMENSIDSGATRIEVSIQDGGRKLISVRDNGCGMDAEDMERAFVPHATSKIKNANDLQSISTLGFRGEALASISSVAQIRAVSRQPESDDAARIEIDCGETGKVVPCSADFGTTIEVRDIFYKLPARRKFLKTVNTEFGHISECFTRIALAKQNLEMLLTNNDRKIYNLSAKDNIHQRIAKLFSSEISENLMDARSDERGMKIFALLGRAEISKTNSKFQYVFINGRFIRDKTISHAIREAYRGQLEPNRFPVVFLFIQMPFDQLDINVHPTKIEVRFYNANLVHSQILGVLREKLLVTKTDISARLGNLQSANEPGRNTKIAEAMSDFLKKHRPTDQQHFGFQTKTRTDMAPRSHTSYATQTIEAKMTNAIQVHDSFIIAETEDGFIVIDQHALHERIMYEDLCRRVSQGKLESQKLLIPESFQVTESQANAVETHASLIEKLGIELSPFGPQVLAIHAFPTLLAKAEPVSFVRDLIDLLPDTAQQIEAETLLDKVLNMAACKAAIKAGQKLSPPEIEQLLADKDKVERDSRCPHGRPTTIKLSLSDLEKQFKRT